MTTKLEARRREARWRREHREEYERDHADLRIYQIVHELPNAEAMARARQPEFARQGHLDVERMLREAAEIFDRYPHDIVTRICLTTMPIVEQRDGEFPVVDVRTDEPTSFDEADSIIAALDDQNGSAEVVVEFKDGTQVCFFEPVQWWRSGVKEAVALETWLEATAVIPGHQIGPWARLWAEAFRVAG